MDHTLTTALHHSRDKTKVTPHHSHPCPARHTMPHCICPQRSSTRPFKLTSATEERRSRGKNMTSYTLTSSSRGVTSQMSREQDVNWRMEGRRKVFSPSLLFLLLFLFHVLLSLPSASAHVQGESMRCHQEGQSIPVPPEVKKDNPCISCSCQNRVVVCRSKPCPSMEGCYWKLSHEKGECCQQCKSCKHEGVLYPHEAQWSTNTTHYHCLSGVLTATNTHCHLPCDDRPIPPRSPETCQSCPRCWLEGNRVEEGQTVTSRADPCVSCTCLKGHLTCHKRACPVLSCPPARLVHNPGTCCKTCEGSRELIAPPGERCFLQSFLYTSGQTRTIDHCTNCTCLGSYITCHRTTCPVLNCPREDQVTGEGECCPKCVDRPYSGKIENCTIHGMTRRNGETWRFDQCTTCTCANGSVMCEFMDCPYMNKPCPPGYKRVESPNECCPRCIEAPGVCMMYGEPHFTTFDGMHFNFQGTCRYILAETDRGVSKANRFSLRVNNDFKKANNLWTKSLTLRLPGTKVKLSQKFRVRVNGKVVKPPYEAPGVFNLTKEGRAVNVATSEGIRVLWDGISYMEVEVPRSLQERIRGLCGNYNGNTTDDILMKEGREATSPVQMAVSWSAECSKRCKKRCKMRRNHTEFSLRRNQRLSCTRKHDVGGECGYLNSTVFQPCHSVVPFHSFYESCQMDKCFCRSHRRCECDALQAYAKQCERAGIQVTDWRKVSGCGGLACPLGAKYMECPPSCRATCRNPTPNPKCHKKRCRPGCYCPPPTVLHRGACVAVSKCPRGKRGRRNRRRNR